MAKMSKAARMLMLRPDREDHYDRYDRMESRFRDRQGREHYDNGRYAPMRGGVEIGGRFRHDPDSERFTAGYPVDWYDEGWTSWPMEGRYADRSGPRLWESRPIGFQADREWGREPRSDMGYAARDEMEYRTAPRMGGYAGAVSRPEPLTRDRAERWVKSMTNDSGAPGQHWTYDQAKQIMTRHGFADDPVDFYAAINMMHSDYCKAAQKLGVDKEDFYAVMADAFLNDEDAPRDKLARYYEYVAQA